MLKLILPVLSFTLSLSATEFIVTTMPKTGSHLLIPFLEKLADKKVCWIPPDFDYRDCSKWKYTYLLEHPDYVPIYLHRKPIPKNDFLKVLDDYKSSNLFLASHIPYSDSLRNCLVERGVKVFHITRDVRDFAVSAAKYYGKNTCSPFPFEWYSRLPFDKQLTVMIEGTEWWNSSRWHIQAFMGWQKAPNCCILRFEKLIGLSGGCCTEEEHLQELKKIAKFLEIEISDEKLLEIFHSVYGSGPTFNRAKTSVWKEAFNDHTKEIFKPLIVSKSRSPSDFEWFRCEFT